LSTAPMENPNSSITVLRVAVCAGSMTPST
jgi:hypothetical protein